MNNIIIDLFAGGGQGRKRGESIVEEKETKPCPCCGCEAVEELKKYQATGLTPEQIIEMDRLYAEKCRELAKCKELGWRERMMNNFLRS